MVDLIFSSVDRLAERERGGRGRNCTTPLGLILPLQLSAMKSSRDRDNCNRREGSRRNEADFTLTKCYFDALRAHPVTSLSRDELDSSSFRPLGSIILRWWKCLSLSSFLSSFTPPRNDPATGRILIANCKGVLNYVWNLNAEISGRWSRG